MNKASATDRLSILHIYSSTSDGGGAVSIADICSALVEREHACHLACRAGAPVLERVHATKCIAHTLPLRNGLDIRSAIALIRLIRHNKVNLIHAHNGRDYPLAFLVSSLTTTPCVFSRHYYRLNRNPLTRALFRRVELVLTVNRSLGEQMNRELQVDANHIRYIPNWANPCLRSASDAARIKRELGLNKDHVVAVIGSINENKGQKDFVEAAAQILQQRNDVSFIIVGVNQKVKRTQLYQDLCATINEQGLDQDIRFFDWVSDVQEILPAVTITVVPSRQEAFGRIAIESMAAGVPVVVTSVGGLKEVVRDGETGLLACPSDPQDLATKIQQLLNDDGMRTRLGTNAHQAMLREYSKDVVVARLEQAYYEALSNHARRRVSTA